MGCQRRISCCAAIEKIFDGDPSAADGGREAATGPGQRLLVLRQEIQQV
jgi:hypothetical protein